MTLRKQVDEHMGRTREHWQTKPVPLGRTRLPIVPMLTCICRRCSGIRTAGRPGGRDPGSSTSTRSAGLVDVDEPGSLW